MARQQFKIEGLKELDEALSELPNATAKNVLRRALKKSAEPVASAARAAAPRAKGKLRTSIVVGEKLSRRQQSLHKSGVGSFSRTVEVFVGAGPLVQAITQEFGTAHHPPQPFMRPAWDANKMKVLESIKDDLANEIAKTVARRARRAAALAAKMRV